MKVASAAGGALALLATGWREAAAEVRVKPEPYAVLRDAFIRAMSFIVSRPEAACFLCISMLPQEGPLERGYSDRPLRWDSVFHTENIGNIQQDVDLSLRPCQA